MKTFFLALACFPLVALAQIDCANYDDCYEKGFNAKTWADMAQYYGKAVDLWKEDEHSNIYLADALSGRGEALMNESMREENEGKGYVEMALNDASRALEVNPKDWRAHYIRGYVAVIKKQGWDSINYHFSNAAAADDQIAYPPFYLANKYYGWKHNKKAKEFASIAIDRLPGRSWSKAANGEDIMTMKFGDTSVPNATRAAMYALRGKILLDTYQEEDSSYQDMLKAKDLDPNNYTAISYLGKLFYTIDPNKSFGHYSELVEKYPEKGEGYFWMGMLQYGAKNYSPALSNFLKAAEIEPTEWPDGWLWASNIYSIQSNWDATISSATKAITGGMTYKPDLGQAYLNRGYAYWQKQQTNYTISDFKKAVDNGNEQARTYLRDYFKINY